MQTFTGSEYVKIDVANCFGLDKLDWNDRLDWFDKHDGQLWDAVDEAKEPEMFRKALYAWEDVQAGNPSGHHVGLDACSSGYQIMAALSNCHTTAAQCGLIDTGHREDAYMNLTHEMNRILPKADHIVIGNDPDKVSHADIKSAGMKVPYGSKKVPKDILIEDSPQYNAFYQAIFNIVPGTMDVLKSTLGLWQPYALHHKWTLPDGHVAYVPIMTEVDKKIEIDELDHATFTHRIYINEGTERGLSLAANIIHSIDAYIMRQMVKMANKAGFHLLCIHDAFHAHPNYCNQVRYFYREILAQIADMNLMQDIAREITGNQRIVYNKLGSGLAKEIRFSNYALS